MSTAASARSAAPFLLAEGVRTAADPARFCPIPARSPSSRCPAWATVMGVASSPSSGPPLRHSLGTASGVGGEKIEERGGKN